MVRKYLKKTVRQEWNTESVNLAIYVVIRGKIGYKKASDQFSKVH